MQDSENLLRTIRFDSPERIPMNFAINPACWYRYDQEALKDLMEEHKILFPDYQRPPGRVNREFGLNQQKDRPYLDPWGCEWQTTEDGITGSVHSHPLADWEELDRYAAPDPDRTNGTFPVDWRQIRENATRARAGGNLVNGGLPHGHTFLRLQDIRGYENLLLDMFNGEPRLDRLIGMVEDFNYRYVMKWMELKPDIMSYPDDLGMQVGPMMSPDCFRKYIKPVYGRIMQPARDRNCIIYMHSDGDLRTLADDLVEAGVNVLNLQDLVNGIDWIAKRFTGRVCIDLDIDRQQVTPFGTPGQVDGLIRGEVEKLGSKRGGLIMTYGLYPGVPLGNVKAVMNAMEKYSTYYS